MKKILTLTIILFMATTVQAQLNPMKGYIITLSGETVNGTIDFLSRSKLARECHFMADGQSDYKTYLPGEIQGFRLSGNGVYFVSRQFPVDGQQQTIFAEFMMQGGVSLYRYENTWTNAQYYLVDESGKVAVVRDPGDLSAYTQENAQKRKQEFLQPALDMLKKSPEALASLQNGPINANRLLAIVRNYNKDYCAESGECIEYQYKAKDSSASNYHFRAEMGGFFGTLSSDHKIDVNVTGLHVGGGVEWFFPRQNQHLSLQLMFALNLLHKSDTYSYYSSFSKENVQRDWKVTLGEIGISVGPNYRFMPHGKITPIVGGGLSVSLPIGNTHRIPYDSDNGEEVDYTLDSDFTLPANVSIYAGGGIEMKLGKHALQALVRYELPICKTETYTKGLVATIGFLF